MEANVYRLSAYSPRAARRNGHLKEPFIRELRPRNILSFGPDCEPIPLRELNVLVGANGSGKSNLIEIVGLLRSSPANISAPVKEVGGVRDWIWNGAPGEAATIDAIVGGLDSARTALRHLVSFMEHGSRFEVIEERIENEVPFQGYDEPYRYYLLENGYPRLFEKSGSGSDERSLPREKINPERSILSQVKDPERYPVLYELADNYEKIRIYREWSFGRYSQPRQPQKPDLPGDALFETCENLPLVLNRLRLDIKVKREIIEHLNDLLPGVEDFDISLKGGAQLYLVENGKVVPATRLSDGTLRYLCLLSILCHPEPPPLICIEEPELGLHPDVLPGLADLLREASQRSQIIVTTHSDIVVDSFTEEPECVVVFEKANDRTTTRRVESTPELSEWLEGYRLGQAWLDGRIGGTRW